MKAYVVTLPKRERPGESADLMTALPAWRWPTLAGVAAMFTPSWNFPAWPDLNQLVLDKLHSMPGVIRTETHVAVER